MCVWVPSPIYIVPCSHTSVGQPRKPKTVRLDRKGGKWGEGEYPVCFLENPWLLPPFHEETFQMWATDEAHCARTITQLNRPAFQDDGERDTESGPGATEKAQQTGAEGTYWAQCCQFEYRFPLWSFRKILGRTTQLHEGKDCVCLIVIIIIFLKQASLLSLGWLPTHYALWGWPLISNLSASTFQVLELYMWTPRTWFLSVWSCLTS